MYIGHTVDFCPRCGAWNEKIDYNGWPKTFSNICCFECGYDGPPVEFFIDGHFTTSDAVERIRTRSGYKEVTI